MNIHEQYNDILDRLDIDKEKPLEDLIDLYCIAINSYEHDIVDSIALFVCDMGNEKTYQYLNKKLAKISDSYIQKEFNGWMNEIRNKVKITPS